MIFIAHRGNLDGPDSSNENKPSYINVAIDQGYDVEVDVHLCDGKWYLGHEHPEYEIDIKFLANSKIWCHAKDPHTLFVLQKRALHCFFINTDDVTLTSRGFLWTYTGKMLTPKSICLMPELTNQNFHGCAGICSDYIRRYRNGYRR